MNKCKKEPFGKETKFGSKYDTDRAQKWSRSGGNHKVTKAVIRATGMDAKWDAKHNPTLPGDLVVKTGLPKQDPFWYAVDQKAIENMASFPFSRVVGDKLSPKSIDYVPTLVRIDLGQCVGNEVGAAVNYLTRSAEAYYNYVMQAYTTAVSNLEAPDLIMIALAEASLASAFAMGKRVYRCMNYYLQLNSGWSRGIVRGLGFDYDDLSKNLANFRAEFNLRAAAFNKVIALPGNFRVSDRWNFLASNLFIDTEDPEYSTVYACNFTKFLKFDATSSNKGTCLKWVSMLNAGSPGYTGYATVAQYFGFLDTLYNALMNDDDVRSVNSAIRKVYGNNLLQISDLEVGEAIDLLKHDIMAMQVHNANMWSPQVGSVGIIAYAPASVMTSGAVATDVPVYQDKGKVYGRIMTDFVDQANVGSKFADAYRDVIIDMYDHLVTPGNVLDATALLEVPSKSATSVVVSSTAMFDLYTRSEVILTTKVIDANGVAHDTSDHVNASPINLVYGDCLLTHLDSHPFIRVSGSDIDKFYLLGEIDKYTAVDAEAIANLHQRCQYQLFMLPEAPLTTVR